MVLRSQSVGEQDAADQQGAFRAQRPVDGAEPLCALLSYAVASLPPDDALRLLPGHSDGLWQA